MFSLFQINAFNAEIFRDQNAALLSIAQNHFAIQSKSLWKMRSPEERRVFLEIILSNQVLDGATARYEMKKPFRTLS